jgi:hypothetical protein
VNLYPFIEAEKTQRSVKRACALLEVSRAAYDANRADSPATPAAGRPGAHRAHPPSTPDVQGPLRRPVDPRATAP